jgi:hypothetical protein
MPLIACFECGSEVSDKANICPRCGVANPSGKKQIGHLKVKRLSKFMGSAVSVSLLVDKALIDKIYSGQEIIKELSVGRHELTFASFMGTDVKEVGRQGGNGCIFEIENGKTTLIEFEWKLAGLQITSVNID